MFGETEAPVYGAHTELDVNAEIARLEDTLGFIEANLQAIDFYEGDRPEVEASRAAYERELRLARLRRELGREAGILGIEAA